MKIKQVNLGGVGIGIGIGMGMGMGIGRDCE